MEIGRMAETEVDAGDVRAAAGGIVDAVDAVVGRVVVVDGTRRTRRAGRGKTLEAFCHGFARITRI
jgi:hypothetical protein